MIFSILFSFCSIIFAQPSVCQINSLSCPYTESIDTCCTPKVGTLVLAQQWLLDYGPSNSFTLHGLWPNYCNGTYTPEVGCDSSRYYKNIGSLINQEPELYNKMNKYWPSYKNDNQEFWTHEWNKHGTCLSTTDAKCFTSFSPGVDVRAYFNFVLNVHDQYNFYKALEAHQITPGRTYLKSQFQAAIDSLGGKSELSCKGNTINEIRMSFHIRGNRTLVPIDSLGKNSCPEKIAYPRKSIANPIQSKMPSIGSPINNLTPSIPGSTLALNPTFNVEYI